MGIRIICAWVILCCSCSVMAEDFFDQGGFVSLVSDNRAHKVGDTLTVLIVESTKAESRAGTGSESNLDLSARFMTTTAMEKAGIGFDRDSGDDANTKREGNFKGQLAVRVVEVDEHGMLKVAGEQVLLINGEEQRIALSGYVRPIDVRDNNTVISNRLTDARIEFNGEGVVNDGQSPGLFTRILSWFGL